MSKIYVSFQIHYPNSTVVLEFYSNENAVSKAFDDSYIVIKDRNQTCYINKYYSVIATLSNNVLVVNVYLYNLYDMKIYCEHVKLAKLLADKLKGEN